MFDINDKRKLIEEMQYKIRDHYLYINKDHENGPMGSAIQHQIEKMVESAVENMACKIIEVLVEHLYTHQDFERDIGLSEQ